MLLAGFYVLALTILVLFGWLLVDAVTGDVNWLRAVIAGSVVVAMLRGVLVFARPADVAGLPVTRQEQPELYALVDEVVATTGLPAPDDIRLTIEVNAAAVEHGRRLGLRPGRRVLVLGLGLLDVVTPAGLRGVIAHELGHHAGGDTRLGAVEYRTHASLERTIDMLGPGLVRWLFRAYHRLVARTTLTSRRLQELVADDVGVLAGGADAYAAALAAIGPAGLVFDRYLDDYVLPLLEVGSCPADLCGGFRAMLSDPEVQEQQSRFAQLLLADTEVDPDDAHPPVAVRLARIGAGRRQDASGPSEPSARSILQAPDTTEQRAVDAWVMALTGGVVRDRMTWQEAADEVYAGGARDVAAAVLEAVGTLTDGRATVEGLLGLLTHGRGQELADTLDADVEDEEDLQGLLEDALGAVTAVELVREQGWRWSVNWSGPLTARDPAGGDQGLAEHVAAVVHAGRVEPLLALLQPDPSAAQPA